jgi:hypothetical protein
MGPRKFLLAAAMSCVLAASATAQALVVVNDPTNDSGDPTQLSTTEQAYLDRALPSVRKRLPEDVCGESLQPAGAVKGSFTRAGAKQMLIFYEYCQTGNGFGWNGLVIVEGGKIVGNFVSEGGWGFVIGRVPDIDQNGIDEFTLAYSGGLHQGAGGTGVDLMQFANGVPKSIGWYKAEEFGETEASSMWKLWAKPGKAPVFYKQKYFSGENRPAKPVGKRAVTKLAKVFVSKFEVVK